VPDEREILERTVRAISERARDAYRVVEEAHEAHPRRLRPRGRAKRLRMELLTTNGELERELGGLPLHCRRCNRRVHWVSGGRSGAGPSDARSTVSRKGDFYRRC